MRGLHGHLLGDIAGVGRVASVRPSWAVTLSRCNTVIELFTVFISAWKASP